MFASRSGGAPACFVFWRAIAQLFFELSRGMFLIGCLVYVAP